MEFKYCINPLDETPIMIISGVIGAVEGSDEGVNGKQFQRELLALDSMGVKNIEVFINTAGGRLSDTYDIFMAIKTSKCKVDTINYGMAASAGFIILQAGRKRKMFNIATAMTHGVYNPFVDGQDDASKAMQEGLVNAVSARIGMDLENTSKLFEGENWYTADKCKEMNFCDEVINTGLMNKPKSMAEPSLNNCKQYDSILNLSQPKPTMVLLANVKEVLNLSTEASEQDIVAKIADLKREKVDSENKANALQKEIEALNAKIQSKEVEEIVNEAVTAGKIKEEVKAEYVNLLTLNFDATKALIDKLPIHKDAVQVNIVADQSRNSVNEGIPADRAEWSHLDWQKNDPKGLQELMNKYPETEKALYNKTYLNK